jgi:hypothetical protein
MIYVIESPFAASAMRTQEEHRIHALKLCRAIALKGAVPLASHVYAPQFLFECRPEEREVGIGIQKRFLWHADGILVWDDWGITRGMAEALKYTDEEVWPVMGIYPVRYHTRGEVPEWDHLDEIELP